ncbi:hypothetical protein BKA04_000880 [Cryobacterium mesophilum]|uniref:Glycosyl transferases group 1 n=1 Tax=Terrimesophilobacter mesophilus TaxID=433647 RepID=A0A4V3I9I0_9MICO|nr:hypothetical protein [Terrimesophilobacter mesophilus]MBB5632657.1 hypothetical protein [Terrimesophilobacter mesophilus]TFB79468.1 hypothetical protein E3N84_05010 [Terrimesophilobacter mesophilus]
MGVGAVSMSGPRATGFAFEVDQRVPFYVYRWSTGWRRAQLSAVLDNYTHVIVESGTPLFGDALGRSAADDIRLCQRRGLGVALLFHGSDIRLPSRHAERVAWSPFVAGLDSSTTVLEARALVNATLVEKLKVPVFVSTPDLLVDLPEAQWLPVVVEVAAWRAPTQPFAHDGPPVVAHAPSRASLKGSDLIDPVLEALENEGLVRYRRIQGVASRDMPDVYRNADIVIDQLRLGIYGVAACEAMAAGRIVVSHVSEQVREYVARAMGADLPVVEATADSLESVLRDIVAAPAPYLETAAAGIRFVEAVHDGRVSAQVLGWFLGAPPADV